MLLKGDFVAYKMIRRAVVLNEAACFLRDDDIVSIVIVNK